MGSESAPFHSRGKNILPIMHSGVEITFGGMGHTEHFEKCRQDPYGTFCQNSLPRPSAGSVLHM